MSHTEQYKIIQLSGDTEFLNYVRLIRINELDSIAKQLLEDRLAKLGKVIEYGCCGTNRIKNN